MFQLFILVLNESDRTRFNFFNEKPRSCLIGVGIADRCKTGEYMEAAAYIRREVNRLGHALGAAIRRHGGEKLFELEEEIRHLTKHLRSHPEDEEAWQRLNHRIAELSLDEAEGVVRAFSVYFHLVNLAEERHRIRVNRFREQEATPERPRSESLKAAIKELRDRGWTAEEVRTLLERMRLFLTLTAHPTETRRLTIRLHMQRLNQVLEALECRRGRGEELDLRVQLIWLTRLLYSRQVLPRDEVKSGFLYLETTLWEALPRLVQALEEALDTYYGVRMTLPSPVRFRSWIGGDRDGNPHITPEVTDWTQDYMQRQILHRYVKEIDTLIQDLSPAQEWVEVTEDFLQRIEADKAQLRLPPRFRGEPFREYLMGVRYRIRALLGEQPPPAYERPQELVRDVRALEEAMEVAHLEEVARRYVQSLRIHAESFGFFGADLDLREESVQHHLAVDELLRVGGVTDAYLTMDPIQRMELLTHELAHARPLAPVGYKPEGRSLQVALEALKVWRAQGAYVISMSHHVSDVLEVWVLAREVGMYRPGVPLPFDVVPLFETMADLERAPEVVRSLLEHPVVEAHVRARGGMEVMIGYSDSNKDAGFLMANWALFRAQEQVAAVGRQMGIPIWFFHGRGTSTARGGAPAGEALEALPPGSLNFRMRLTEQGEALADKYGHPDLAFRNLEQLLYHMIRALARDAREETPPEEPSWRMAMDRAAHMAMKTYRALVDAPDFFTFFEQLTPIREIAELNIASRPVYRHGRVRDIRDLRAIPWVMAWTQVRANLPGWYGLGRGLAEIPLEHLREMYRNWPFFRSVLSLAELSLAKADLGITRSYLRLVDPALANRFYPTIEEEFHRTMQLLEAIMEGPLLKNNPTLAESIRLRNPYVDPLNYVQAELLGRYRTLPETSSERIRLRHILQQTLLGIAAGLRNTG